jgi:hypothetical protein
MKLKVKFTGLLVALLFMLSILSTASGKVSVSGKAITIYTGSGPFHGVGDYEEFTAAYDPDNTLVVDDVNLATGLTGVDVLMLPANDFTGGAANVTAIATWFASAGDKLLWVAADDDYGGYFQASGLNPVLAAVGSVLRIDAGGINDPVTNDGAPYRIMPTVFGTGPIAKEILKGINNASTPFHGPAPIYANVSGTATDLRNTAVTNVEVVISTSATAISLDQDTSLSAGDFYYGTTGGKYPLLVVEDMTAGKKVVVSGETIFCDYKFMYGDQWENSALPHEGKALVDNTIAWGLGVDRSSKSDSPFDMTFFVASLGLVAVFTAIRRRKL